MITLEKKRKLIDVREDTLRTLSVKAAMEGTSLKKLIEEMLINEADKIEADAEYKLYVNLLQTDPDGKIYLNPEETLTFERQMGL
jgi:hypothetical protein